MLVMLGLGLSRLAEINAQMDELANRTFRRAEAVYTMRVVARDRLASLQSMFFMHDPFERDEERLRYDRMALAFIQARDTLLGLNPGAAQREAWQQARALIVEDEKLHEQALDAMVAERLDQAARIIRRDILPLEARLIETLDGMLEIERAETQRLLADANDRYRSTWLLLVLLTGLTLAVMLATAIHVTRRSVRNETLLQEARRRAEEAAQKLSWAASHDALTGLPNRRMFEIRLHEVMQRARNGQGSHALAYLDLDDFKPVNDRHGHEAGDQLLKGIARTMQARVPEGATLARLGGDEFGLLLPGHRLEEAQAIVVDLGRVVAEFCLPWGEHVLRVGMSGGVVAIDPALTATELVHQADQACYQAKARRRGHRVGTL